MASSFQQISNMNNSDGTIPLETVALFEDNRHTLLVISRYYDLHCIKGKAAEKALLVINHYWEGGLLKGSF